ncbi:MAG: hypothetical protein DWQ31_13480 [Planctomycetota bacterium]|nr:MAG: hypothetical protein DWQ31_13480 [Planctomycetota bacterium]REJ86904.1 MAG: hypothetical protein DWQ35_22245 [Planctomycetota bacterium]REK26612.1 MAG: hypothetical protein DWQ42_08580 [Planctomycetota bacterium]REK38417.1 MAG: hypothetical protein DWQ46_20520 [Planctomycetota bacterium]
MSRSFSTSERRVLGALHYLGFGLFLAACTAGFVRTWVLFGNPPSIDPLASHRQYIQLLDRKQDYESAVDRIEIAQQLAPYTAAVDGLSIQGYGQIGLGLLERGHPSTARLYLQRLFLALEQTTELPSDDAEMLDMLARILDRSYELGTGAEAILKDSLLLSLLNNLAWIRATHRSDSIRNAEQALRFASRAADMTKREDPSLLDTLAAAYAEAGRWQEARQTERLAVAQAERAGVADVAISSMKQRLSLYEDRLPYRE